MYETRKETFGAMDKESLRAALASGDLYAESGQTEEALKWYQKAQQEEGENLYVKACQKAAILLLQSGEYHDARRKLEKAKGYLESNELVKTKEYCEVLGLFGDLFYARKEKNGALGFYEGWARLWKELQGEKKVSYIKRMGRTANLLVQDGRKRKLWSISVKWPSSFVKKKEKVNGLLM